MKYQKITMRILWNKPFVADRAFKRPFIYLVILFSPENNNTLNILMESNRGGIFVFRN